MKEELLIYIDNLVYKSYSPDETYSDIFIVFSREDQMSKLVLLKFQYLSNNLFCII